MNHCRDFRRGGLTDGGRICCEKERGYQVDNLYLADKLLVTAALLSLVEMGRLGAWVAMIIIGREFAVTGLRLIAASEGIVIAASNLGKFKTFFQIIAIIAILLKDYPFSIVNIPMGSITLVVAVFFTIYWVD